jgi:hypothetical protein
MIHEDVDEQVLVGGIRFGFEPELFACVHDLLRTVQYFFLSFVGFLVREEFLLHI